MIGKKKENEDDAGGFCDLFYRKYAQPRGFGYQIPSQMPSDNSSLEPPIENSLHPPPLLHSFESAVRSKD